MSFGANNDSFGCINNDDNEMDMDRDIDNQSNSNHIIINDTNQEVLSQTDLIQKKIDNSLNALSHILTSRHSLLSYRSILSLPSKSFSISDYNSIKASIILQRLRRAINVLLSQYKQKQYNVLYIRFILWSRKAKVELVINESKSAIEAQFNLRFDDKKKQIEALIDNKQKEINKSQETINKINDSITKMNNKIKCNEEREVALNKTFKDLQEDHVFLEGEFKKSTKSLDTNCNSNGNNYSYSNSIGSLNTNLTMTKSKLTNRISELEQTIKSLEEEIKEKDNSIHLYVKEMNEMLDGFEEMTQQLGIGSNNSNNNNNGNDMNNGNRNGDVEEGDRHKWKSPTNIRTNTLKNSFNVLPNNNINSNSINNNHQIQSKYSYNQGFSKQGLKIVTNTNTYSNTNANTNINSSNNTINTKTINPGPNSTTNTSKTSRGLFINIIGNTNKKK